MADKAYNYKRPEQVLAPGEMPVDEDCEWVAGYWEPSEDPWKDRNPETGQWVAADRKQEPEKKTL